MAILVVTAYGLAFYAFRAPRGKWLYALLGGGVGALSVISLFAICYYVLGFRMTFGLDLILTIVGGTITSLVGVAVVKNK